MKKIRLSHIPIEWKKTHGKDIKIGICDSGCDINHKDIKIKEYREFGEVDYKHGTHVLGIISSNSHNFYSIHGLCDKSEIYFSGCNFVNQNSISNLISSLAWLKSKKIDVLNLSFALKHDNKEIKSILFDMYNSGTIICCSYSDELLFPHSYDFTISVGKESDIEKKVDIVAPSKFISLAPNNDYIEMSGASMATAFISSIAGIAKSFNKKINKGMLIKEICGESILNIESNSIMNSRKKQVIFRRK